jgi:hypothetical protein
MGEVYLDGEVIIRQGDAGGCMYVIQEGQVEFVVDQDCKEVRLGISEGGHFLGEMAIFERRPRFATVPALGQAERGMSLVMWDMFTGSAPYKEVFLYGPGAYLPNHH